MGKTQIGFIKLLNGSLFGIKINIEMFFLVDEMFKQKGNTIETMEQTHRAKISGQ